MYCYITPTAQQKAEKYHIVNEIEELRQTIENAPNLQTATGRFEPLYPYLKRRIGKLYRLIAKPIKFGSDEVLCIYEIYMRKDLDYEQFVNDRRRVGPKKIDVLLDETILSSWLAKRKEEGETTTEQLPSLDDNLRPWLQPPGWVSDDLRDELIVYESPEWENMSTSADFRKFWQTYHEIILALTENKAQTSKLKNWPHLELTLHKGRGVIFARLRTADTPPAQVLYLITPFVGRPTEDEIADKLKSITFLNILENDRLTLDDLASCASRSYPAFIVWDETCWDAIQCEKEANLALSAEEENVLRSVSTQHGKVTSLPIFINGRAGSGKSTMLIYLFADYCHKKLKNNLEGELLYLTYNERLLTVARDGVKRLLESHHKFLAEGSVEHANKMTDDLLGTFFYSFQQFLLENLSEENRLRFSKNGEKGKYMSFYRFKRLYNNLNVPEDERAHILKLPQAKKWSAELAWHVIRTYIKGRTLDGFIEPDDYTEIPRKERSVDFETYGQIYETIWQQWYSPLTSEEAGYWDDQDLVRQVLKDECWEPKYAAIFCDEAQDFTRLELQLIMRLSLFSNFDLGWEPINSLPFAFAGDPFQTLNPTGFRWPSVQAAFYDEVISALDPLDRLKLGINFQELTYNYRSLPSVVCATNLIQLWRRVLLDITELQPQTSWQNPITSDEKSVRPQIFVIGDNISADELARRAENTIFIVPVEEGEERAFVERDPVLSKIVPISELGDPPKNVLSAIAAKGLEFDRVILYNFGDFCQKPIFDSLIHLSNNEDLSIEHEYFLNKLYVAASRAKKLLFVVDSKAGMENLWKNATTKQKIQDLLVNVKNPEFWSNNVCHIPLGTPDNIIEIAEKDPKAIAHELKTKGLSLQNPDNLRRAKQFYHLAGNKKEADLCEAWAKFYEEDYRGAGRVFLDSGRIDDAWKAFAQGQCWPELYQWYQAHPGRRRGDPPLQEMAEFMVSRPNDTKAFKSFIDFLLTRSNQNKLGDRYNPNWREVIKELALRLEKTEYKAFNKEYWLKIAQLLVALKENKFADLEERIANSFYNAGDYSNAAIYWEKSRSPKPRNYWIAKAESQGMPKGLVYLDSIEADEQIISKWENAGGLHKAKSRDWLKFVGPALERQNHYSEAFYVYLILNETGKSLDYFDKAFSRWSEPQRWSATEFLMQYLIRKGLWKDAIAVVNSYFPKFVGPERDSQKNKLRCDIVREIAYKTVSAEALATERSTFEEFVAKTLDGDGWASYLSIPEAGAALERIGGFVTTLRFYEKIEKTTNDRETLDFVRKRWIATKNRQVEHFRKQGESGFPNLQKSSNELSKRTRTWNLSPTMPLPQLPKLPPRKRQYLGITGLPEGIRVEEQTEGNYRFQIQNIEVRTDRDGQVVLLIDNDNLDTVHVKFNHFKVEGQAHILSESSDEGLIVFESQNRTIRGTFNFKAEQPFLELRIADTELSISLV